MAAIEDGELGGWCGEGRAGGDVVVGRWGAKVKGRRSKFRGWRYGIPNLFCRSLAFGLQNLGEFQPSLLVHL